MSDTKGNALAIPERPGVVATSILSDDEIGRVWRIAKSLAASGLFKDVTQAEQAFGRILLGRDLGLSPTQSLMVLDVVEGNVRVRSVQLAAWVKQHPDYDYQVLEHTAEVCRVQFTRNRHDDAEHPAIEILGESAFSIEDAKNAQLIKDHPKSAWRAHPRNMLWARAMSNGVRWYCPEVTGGIPVYTEADSFEDRRVGAGEGDGSEPGWQGISVTQAAALEKMLERAAELGHAGLSDRATVQMRVNGQTPAYVDQQLIYWANELNALALEKAAAEAEEEIPEADVVPDEPEPEADADPEQASMDVDGAS